jgi:hypothetical protein
VLFFKAGNKGVKKNENQKKEKIKIALDFYKIISVLIYWDFRQKKN